jgi:hypothetical protein
MGLTPGFWLLGFDPAVALLASVWGHSEQREVTGEAGGFLDCGSDRSQEARFVEDKVIGRKDRHRGKRLAVRDVGKWQQDPRGGVTIQRLEEHILLRPVG